MGAYSVTGISGAGAAQLQKGPGNGRNQFVPLASPGVVLAGTVTAAAGGTLTVAVSGLTQPAASYVVLVSGQVDATKASSVFSKHETSSVFDSFVITATGAGLIGWTVVALAGM